MRIDDRQCGGMTRGVVDNAVELAVGDRHGFVRACGDVCFQLRRCFAQAREMLGGAALRRTAGEHGLDGGAHVEQVLDEAAVHRTHVRTPVGLDHDEAFAMQHAQRLADRHVADAVTAREVLHDEARAECECARHDVVAQPLLDVQHCLGLRKLPARRHAPRSRAAPIPACRRCRSLRPAPPKALHRRPVPASSARRDRLPSQVQGRRPCARVGS